MHERERELARLWKTSIYLGDRKLRQAHNDDPTVRSSDELQQTKAKEEVDEKDIGERFAAIGNTGASGKFQRDLEYA